MQPLNTVRLRDKLLLANDVSGAIQSVTVIPDASEANLNKIVFLSSTDDPKYHAGVFYKCISYYETNILTGLKFKAYKWVEFSADAIGKLGAYTSALTITRTAQADNCVTVRLNWAEPDDVDVINNDPTTAASWLYTVVVRKQGNQPPASSMDGEIVGYSSVRDQYKTGTGFVDVFSGADVGRYSYNVFAVTAAGKETGAVTASSSGELTWADVRKKINAGRGGEVFAVGDVVTINHATFGELEFQVVAFDNAVPKDSNIKHTVTLMSRHVITKVPFDVAELHVDADGEINPGDRAPNKDKWSSVRGLNSWDLSGLCAWLNGPITDPDYEKYLKWHVEPNTQRGDAVYPAQTFIDGLDKDLREQLVTTKITFNEYRFNSDGSTTIEFIDSFNKVFIPSYRELFGLEQPGMRNKKPTGGNIVHEGWQFDYFNRSVSIPDLNEVRTVLKQDLRGVVTGYYLRSIETEKDTSTGGWIPTNMSGLYVVDPKDHDLLTPLDTNPSEITSCRGAHMTATESENDSTPGVVVCIVL